MSSTWIKFVFILTLVLLPYSVFSVNIFAGPEPVIKEPNCTTYKSKSECSNIAEDPVCADDRNTYYNECYFCIEKVLENLKYRYHGICIYK
ncbi:serine protease inhibitor kazal-like protein, minor form [Mus caroli]|uniref:Serine protease inhibitor kazal-like protein, minor form n=1 Tax=Mus caroli TaxID=10089 RepID=A0A6P5P378_MUSCR|nr:serine protease inhibitor kazal-like protein, minor form [Mus caroli]